MVVGAMESVYIHYQSYVCFQPPQSFPFSCHPTFLQISRGSSLPYSPPPPPSGTGLNSGDFF